MTTRAWNYPIAHASDANFRGWGSDLSASLLAVGLVKTADTGQIDWATVTRPAVGVYAGYEVWRFPDSSIFMKWEFGTSSAAATAPLIAVTVGTGSNGSGTLTGVTTARRSVSSLDSGGLSSAGTQRLSLMVLTNSFFGFHGYQGSNGSSAWAFFAVAKTVDANAVPTNLGAFCYWRSTANTPNSGVAVTQALNFQTSTALTADTSTGAYSLIPQNITSSLVGSDQQVFVHWAALPRVYPVMPVVTVVSSEFSLNTTFQAAVIGTAPRTYVALDSMINGSSTGSTTYKFAMLWE